MARINIENDLFIRQGWLDLVIVVGNSDAALGALVRAWMVAQRYWKDSDLGIPKPVWKRERLNDAILGKLADDNGDFVYVHGSREQFAWLRDLSEAGKRGGLKTQEKNRSKALPGSSQLKPFEASSSSSPSSSFSLSNKEDIAPRAKAHVACTPLPEFSPIADVIEARAVAEKTQRAWLEAFLEPEWIISEVRKAVAWESADPRRVKKKFGVFMTSWLTRGWDARRTLPTVGGSRNYAADRQAGNQAALGEFLASLNGGIAMKGVT